MAREMTDEEKMEYDRLTANMERMWLWLDPLTMPPELRKAHQLNDKAVMQAYGMPIKETDEAACVAWLMKLYQEKVNNME